MAGLDEDEVVFREAREGPSAAASFDRIRPVASVDRIRAWVSAALRVSPSRSSSRSGFRHLGVMAKAVPGGGHFVVEEEPEAIVMLVAALVST